jgi:hypothetical protein
MQDDLVSSFHMMLACLEFVVRHAATGADNGAPHAEEQGAPTGMDVDDPAVEVRP